MTLEEEMIIDFRDGRVKIFKGEMFIVPRGVEMKPSAEEECHIMLVEPGSVVNTDVLSPNKQQPMLDLVFVFNPSRTCMLCNPRSSSSYFHHLWCGACAACMTSTSSVRSATSIIRNI
ncbi:MAG: cupin [Paenibacillus sp.]|jgi:hypothetical protein|nr:cupin [Paenibacillus sp.]